MNDCPACVSSPLTEFTVHAGATVELCRGCKGMLVSEEALSQLAAGCDLGALRESGVALAGLGACLRCNTANWQRHLLGGAAGAGLGLCGTCGMVWFRAGELDRLQQHLLAEKRRARAPSGAPDADVSRLPSAAAGASEVPIAAVAAVAHVAHVASVRATEPFERVSFDEGAGNRLGVPVALGLGLSWCATAPGQFSGSLVAMPFHELGHALASWLGSRFAVPLPFFTVWSNEQSLAFGLCLAALIGWFGFRSLCEGRRFGVVVALSLLVTQLALSCGVSSRVSGMCQILGGALGEIVLGALVLIAFHFPLPDRLRWDFWRWPALLPGAVCFGHAVLTWVAAAHDARRIPWGSAIGDESDGDMNRLVRDFGWSAAELGRFYLAAVCLSALVLAAAYALAFQRQRQRQAQGMARMPRQKSTA